MTDRLPPAHLTDVAIYGEDSANSLTDQFQEFGVGVGQAEEEAGVDWGRYAQALKRYKWVVLLILLSGAASSAVLWRTYEPEYMAQGALWVQTGGSAQGSPISGGQLLQSYAWINLLRSWSVLDTVAVRHRLYVRHGQPADSVFFSNFTIEDSFQPGSFVLRMGANQTVTLSDTEDRVLDEVTPGSPLGRDLGFRWTPSARHLAPGVEIPFQVVTPRDAASELAEKLATTMDQLGSFISLELAGKDRVEISNVVNEIMNRTVALAGTLKRGQLDERTRILSDQLRRTEQELRFAETTLEEFRVQTITLPSDQATPIAAGLQLTRDPVYQRFFRLRGEVETIDRDLEHVNRALATFPDSGVRVEAMELIPAVAGSSELRGALTDLTAARTELRGLRFRYTNDHPPVRELIDQIAWMEQNTIPAMTRAVRQGLINKQAEADRMVTLASNELSEIPPRTTEESRLQRRVDMSGQLYTDIRQRFESASLAAASSIPDVRVLDRASVPQLPMSDQRIRLILLLMVGSLGAGLAAAILLDRVDPRVRYPSDVTADIGLGILGTIPHIQSKRGTPTNMAQVLESFRELRLNTSYAYGAAGPVILTISSPAQSEGKSFVSSNLAIAFAEFGRRTLLIDGDTRRGGLHSVLNVERRPGLTDVLSKEESLRDAIQETEYTLLHVITSGTRVTSSPELLGSAEMQKLLAEVRSRFDVIIVDSPPMGAGSDALILGALTGNLALVVRNGGTNKEFMQQKMAPLSRLPIRVLGAILNDVPSDGAYRYYSNYLTGYDATSEDANGTKPRQLIQS